jgi:hypothetical protein
VPHRKSKCRCDGSKVALLKTLDDREDIEDTGFVDSCIRTIRTHPRADGSISHARSGLGRPFIGARRSARRRTSLHWTARRVYAHPPIVRRQWSADMHSVNCAAPGFSSEIATGRIPDPFVRLFLKWRPPFGRPGETFLKAGGEY